MVAGRPCLVVGGGPVGARKIAGLLACGAEVTVVAPLIDPSIDELAGTVTVERRPYRRGEVAGYRLVVTATGVPEVDGAVAEDAEAAGVWVNSADDIENCSFMLPAVHRDGPVTVAISTNGASPALARWLRRRVRDSFGDGFGETLAILAGLLAEARQKLQAMGRPTESLDWQGLLDGPLVELVRCGRIEDARDLLDAAIGGASVKGAATGVPS